MLVDTKTVYPNMLDGRIQDAILSPKLPESSNPGS
jgi:hypothetical protein